MTNLQTATNAAPSVLVAQYVPSTGAAQYTAAVGTTAELASVTLHNTDTVARTVTFSVVKAGGSAGGGNRRLETVTMAAKEIINLGQMFLGDGDFIWAAAGTTSTIALVVTGIEFSNATGAVLSGIQDDAIGTGGRTASSSTVGSTNAIGTGSGRRLYGALMVTHHTSSVGFASYDTLTMTCNGGSGPVPMTRLISCDFNQGGNLNGSVHIFEKISPTSASSQALLATVVESGLTVDLTLASISLSGIASVAGATSSGPTTAAALSLAASSAAGHRTLMAAIFQDPPMDFNERIRGFNGNPAIGAAVPHWMVFADALGAATVTSTTSNSQLHAAVKLDLVPA